MLFQLILLGAFICSSIIGYLLINNVPSLLHTPLMSGMNALSGITILGALVTTALVVSNDNKIVSSILGSIAIIFATINIVGGFSVTDRMLKMFRKEKK